MCTQQQNLFNSKISSKNTSGVKGVHWHKQLNKWRAEIKINGKKISLGCYYDLEEAKKARELAEEKYQGKFAYRNRKERV